MLITDHLIYIELHKTGSTHTKKVLTQLFGNNVVQHGNHNAYYTVAENLLGDFDAKVKLGNIRNPWDWYVSLWAFGCMKKGGAYHRLTKNSYLYSIPGVKKMAKNILSGKNLLYQISTIPWKHLYSDATNPVLFRKWLVGVLTSKNVPIGEGYSKSPASRKIGLMTYRYLKLYCKDSNHKLLKIRSLEEAVAYDESSNFMDIILQIEHLHQDILNNCDQIGVKKETLQKVLSTFQKRSNTSVRMKFTAYYDAKTVALVKEKEHLIISKYKYTYS